MRGKVGDGTADMVVKAVDVPAQSRTKHMLDRAAQQLPAAQQCS